MSTFTHSRRPGIHRAHRATGRNPARPGAGTRPGARRRGSVMLLTVGVLALIIILALAYMQVARLDRVGTSNVTERNIDMVARATVEQLQQVLKDDLMDSDGNFFNAAPENAFEPGTAPFDYPWTNPDPNSDRNRIELRLSDGTEATAYGGHTDGMWLAATLPDFTDPDNPVWPKITNLNGLFLALPTEDAPDNQRRPREDVVDFGPPGNPGPWWRDNELRITGNPDAQNIPLDTEIGDGWRKLGADATGDGVEDSRWTWAPIRQIGGTRYVMAVRVVDNASMLNVNTALSQVDRNREYDTGSTMPSDAPRWWYPSELDFGGFFLDRAEQIRQANLNATAPANEQELENYLTYLLEGEEATGTIDLPVPWGLNALERGHFWLNGPSMYGNFNNASQNPNPPTDYQRLGVTNELALRWRGGLSGPELANTRITRPETGMPVFLRADADEWHYTHFTGGGDPTNPNFQHDADLLRDYFRFNPKHGMTVRSGASILAARLGREQPFRLEGAPATLPGRALKADINQSFLFPSDRTGLAEAILRVYDPEDTNLSGPNNDDWPPGIDNAEEFAAQFAANILDYTDNDNLLTRVPLPGAAGDDGENGDADEGDEGGLTGNERWGMEALPFAVEFYVQREYQGEILEVEGEDGDGLPITINHIQWTATGPAGYAIEIRNPFRRPILLSDVYLMVDNTNWGPLDQMSESNNPFHPYLPPDHVLVLYREAQDGTEDGGVADGDRRVREQIEHIDAPTTITVDLADADEGEWGPRIWPEVDEEFPIGLHASWSDEGGAAQMLPWPYQRSDRQRGIPAEHLQENAMIPEGIDNQDLIAYRQSTTLGNAQRAQPSDGDQQANILVESLNMVTIRPEDFERNDTGPPALLIDPDPEAEGSFFGLEYREDVPQLGIPQFVGDADKAPPVDGHVTRAMDADLTLAPQEVLGRNQIVFSGLGTITHIGELAHIAILGPTPNRTVAEVWHGEADNRGRVAESVDEFLLRFRPPQGQAGPVFNQNYPPPGLLERRAATDPDAYDHLRVPHAVALIDQFTTLSPAVDGMDNDGSGQADELAADGLPAEQFVAGTINLNTISRDLSSLDEWSGGSGITPTHLLWHVLPIADEEVRESVIRAIVNYRELAEGFADNSRNTFISGYRGDDTAGLPGLGRSSPGIAHLAELMNAIGPSTEPEPIGQGASGRIDILGDSMDNQRYGGIDAWRMFTPDASANDSVPIDFRTDPLLGAQPDVDRIVDDRKEKAMIAKWLSQVASVRSDIFTAYVLIRGYPADDFRLGPTEQMRFFVVLDRSRLTDRDGRVRVLAVHQF